MVTLMAYIDGYLAEQLKWNFTLSNSASPTYVFKWLKTADELQLDQLKDMCFDALGTYLLPEFPSHSSASKSVLSQLSGPVFADVAVAIGRCSSCMAKYVINECSSTCPGRNPGKHASYPTRQEQRNFSPTCGVCTFKPKTVTSHTAVICSYCGKWRSWA